MFRRAQQSIDVCLSAAILIATLVSPGWAGVREAKERISAEGTAKGSLEKQAMQGAPVGIGAIRPAVGNKQAQVVQRPKHFAETSQARRSKTHRRTHVNRMPHAKVTIQPSRRELAFHGLLETPQRYDPRLNHRAARMPAIQTPELAQDQFVELDRNQDGHVDPVERTLGRLDMEHDLQPR
ncbi:MAG: hypothetical protein P0111_13170 [Nitrospira sp.]|nr:hypothetical protein [Nitrospira sp.]